MSFKILCVLPNHGSTKLLKMGRLLTICLDYLERTEVVKPVIDLEVEV